ncbi:MAG TPA: ATP synthase F0 subunit C [Aggregatilineales bacterium]|nr:ATP synthase F0 subunit C [Aggregatilineales bacterium]
MTPDFGAQFVIGMKALGAGLAMVGALGAGVGIGSVVNGALQAMGRNPDASGNLLTNMILGIVFSETIAIYCLVVALIILFVLG